MTGFIENLIFKRHFIRFILFFFLFEPGKQRAISVVISSYTGLPVTGCQKSGNRDPETGNCNQDGFYV